MSPETEKSYEQRHRAYKMEQIKERLKLSAGSEEEEDTLREWAEEVDTLEKSAQEKIENINYPYGDVKVIVFLKKRNGQPEISIQYFGIVTEEKVKKRLDAGIREGNKLREDPLTAEIFMKTVDAKTADLELEMIRQLLTALHERNNVEIKKE